ncbi:MAG TPA: acyl-CoA dehydrogenase family protein [Acidimicrobiia bacterium]|nr:acyl-CoA dehydrogenase family protein [Acidimicrobiia bacterium]
MDFALPPSDDPDRLEVRRWLETHPNPSPRVMAEAGYVVPGWPRPWGRAAAPTQQLVISQEMEAAGIDPHQHNPIGIGWAGPTILAAGTGEQKDRFLWPLLRGEEFWCQLFSEPGAGSDLAGLSTRAERDGDDWIVNGQKVWTTWAGQADFGILLARTDPGAPRHRGISYFICPMRQDGIEVRPIKEMTGRSHFNEVFISDVRIPGNLLVGAENQGWALAKLTLGNERISLSGGGVLWGMGPTTAEVLDSLRGRLGGPARDRAATLFIEGEIIRLLGYRIVSDFIAGRPPGPEVAVKKLVADRHGQRAMDLVRDCMGAEGMVAGEDEAAWGYLFSPALTVGGGTSEILHNVIGEQVLGLPKDQAVEGQHL